MRGRWRGRHFQKACLAALAIALYGATARGAETALASSQGVATCPALLSARYAGLDQELVRGDLRIRWAASGVHALADQRDSRASDVPDVIDDLMTQLVTAREVYRHGLGLVDPLDRQRYMAARAITFFVMDLPRGNGLAFDEVTRLPGEESGGGLCSLVAVVSNRLAFSRNVTGAHELFHLFQYGYSMFKTPWLLEGMARWSEGLFAGAVPRRLSRSAPADCMAATQLRNGAAAYWTSRWRESQESRPLPDDIAGARYRNGAHVLPSTRPPRFPIGWNRLRDQGALDKNGSPSQYLSIRKGSVAVNAVHDDLEALARLGDSAAENMGLSPHAWPESLQRSARFDADICAALQ